MSDKPTPAPKPAPEKSPLDRTADLMRRVIAVPKGEALRRKRHKPKRK